ncbi:MAG: putative Ig domain-containing protein [Bacteroidetes bacterium]|nr:putative Ig domain-containing protein [Bacteroidota bacterium]
MKNQALTAVLLLLIGLIGSAQPIPPDSLYFGQIPPGNTPQIFAPGKISLPGRNEAVITFSPDGASAFFYIEKYPTPEEPYTLFTTYANNHWTIPDTIPFSVGRSTGEPFFAYNGNRLYMYATNAINHHGITDLSYSEKQGASWSNPISLGNPPNSEDYQYHPCIVGDTSIYFSSFTGNVCRCQFLNGTYQNRVILPTPVNFIGSQTWGDPYVSPDESYMIIKSIRDGGFGQNDLYISYFRQDSTWTNPKNLGNVINTPLDETSGDITPDGLYMTYGSNKDLYWVSTSFIDSLKYTNFVPYLKNPIPAKTAYTGQFFTYTIPDSTFFDDDGNNTLAYSAQLTSGTPLPGWLAFDSISRTFSGTPAIAATLNIKVKAIDTARAFASGTFKLNVKVPVAVQHLKEPVVTIFPNPASGLIHISLDAYSGKTALVEVRNLEGKVILTGTFKDSECIDLTSKPKGMYIFKLLIDQEIVTRKVYIE